MIYMVFIVYLIAIKIKVIQHKLKYEIRQTGTNYNLLLFKMIVRLSKPTTESQIHLHHHHDCGAGDNKLSPGTSLSFASMAI